jgi:ABC-type sulfate transport system permease subunit
MLMRNLRYKFFKSFAIFLFFVFVLNTLASHFHWYFTISEFDMLMHFLGGITAAIFSFWLLYKKYVFWIESDKKWKAFRVTMLVVLIIALLWEVMEFSVQGYFKVKVLADVPDSISDVIMGLLGAVFGYFYVLRKYKRERSGEHITI